MQRREIEDQQMFPFPRSTFASVANCNPHWPSDRVALIDGDATTTTTATGNGTLPVSLPRSSSVRPPTAMIYSNEAEASSPLPNPSWMMQRNLSRGGRWWSLIDDDYTRLLLSAMSRCVVGREKLGPRRRSIRVSVDGMAAGRRNTRWIGGKLLLLLLFMNLLKFNSSSYESD